MSYQFIISRIIGGAVLAAVLMGCSTPTPTVAPTENIQATLDAVKTQSAGTVVANLTLNAPVATKTSAPVATKTVQPTLIATNTLLPWWTKTPTQPSGGCEITEYSPKMNDVFSANATFDGKWVVKNVSGGKWLANNVDFRYASGTKFQDSVDVIDLKNDVDEESSYTIVVDMHAPASAGTYATTWVVNNGGKVVCSLPLTIIVK
jgi:hypothetical protein